MLQKVLVEFALLILRLISYLPLSVSKVLGNGLGRLAYYLAPGRRRVGLKNLSLCFPKMSETEKQQIIKKHFKYLMTSALEYGFVFYASEQLMRKLVKFKNEHFYQQHYGKSPIIFLCPHFVGLDMLSIRLTLDITGYSIYSRQKNSYVTEKITKARMRFLHRSGGEIFARQDGLRPVIKKLRESKKALYYLPDQDFGERDSIYVPFFAYSTCATVSVLPKLVRLTNAVVVPLVIHKRGLSYEAEFFEAWDNYPSGNLVKDVTRMNKFVEQVIDKNIAQYFWLHKRFKTQPNMRRGALYDDC